MHGSRLRMDRFRLRIYETIPCWLSCRSKLEVLSLVFIVFLPVLSIEYIDVLNDPFDTQLTCV